MMVAALCVLVTESRGQTFEAGIFGGTSYYMGDLNPEPTSQFANAELPAFGIFTRYNYNNHIAFKAGLNHGTISGTDANSVYSILPGSTYHFKTMITELALQAEVNFLPYVAGDPESLYTPYIFGGVSGFYFDSTPKESDPAGNLNVLTDDQHRHQHDAVGYSNISYAYLFGIGLKYHVTNQITGGIEWGLRHTFTNDLDEVHLNGNPKNKDWYSFAGLTFTIRFRDRSSAVCPYHI